MLKIKDKDICEKISVEIDPYIPFTLEVNRFVMLNEPSIYFRCGDGKRNLVEIGLERKTGCLKSITLTTIEAERVKEKIDSESVAHSESIGMAIFDVSSWGFNANQFGQNYQDSFDSNISLLLGQDYLILKLNDGAPIEYIKNNQLRFGVDKSQSLSSLEIIDLDEDEINILRKLLK